ncbi:MAG: hypothetical protein H0T61_08175 [Actinobacteria bacterium]|nr:hypothetical protein [Actinomycetota bacterium]
MLGRRGAVLANLLDRDGLEALRQDAVARHRSAAEMRALEPDEEIWRGGSPDRWLESAPGGEALQAFYHSPRVLDLLQRLTGMEWTQSGLAGTYSYYRRPGHHLGLHRDIDECDLAVITCVHDSSESRAETGGALCLYPERVEDPLPELRARPDDGAAYVRLEPGQSVVLLGGRVPHRVLPVGEEHVRIVAPLCYRALGS